MRRKIAGSPVHGRELERSRARGIDRYEDRQAEPLSDHDLAPAHRPRKHGEQQPALDLARDERTSHDRGAQGEHAAEHEDDHDQQLRGDQRNLVRRQQRAVGARDGGDLVEAPRGKADDEQGQDQQREQQPPP